MRSFSQLKIDGISDCHCQGIAIDKKREYMYFSFTTSLIKTDLKGNIIGSVKGIVGHLGCIAYNDIDNKIYGSLEYKNDSIGRDIINTLNSDIVFQDRFYIASFDADKITRKDMDAEKDGIMTAAYLSEVIADYSAKGHRYGCSGIDGITLAPKPGSKEGTFIYVAYGIYDDTRRRDNNYQIILSYDYNKIISQFSPLKQDSLHLIGPECYDNKYFVYTGNTDFGIQNLEYDKDNNCLFAAVYKGRKLCFPNYRLFAIDINCPSEYKRLRGLKENGNVLKLKNFGFFKHRGKIYGSNFKFGSEGMISLGDNKFLFVKKFRNETRHGAIVSAFRLHPDLGFIEEEIDLI